MGVPPHKLSKYCVPEEQHREVFARALSTALAPSGPAAKKAVAMCIGVGVRTLESWMAGNAMPGAHLARRIEIVLPEVREALDAIYSENRFLSAVAVDLAAFRRQKSAIDRLAAAAGGA